MRLIFPMLFLMGIWGARAADLPVVPSVDLQRYAGKWYEIARLPNRFERSCVSDVTATYTLRPDGDITVVNACKKADGSMNRAEGKAKLADKDGPNSKLKVTFFWPFYGKYWIINLDPDYKWAVVGEPGRDYLWILARSPKIPGELYDKLLADARAKGFDTSKMIRSPQSGQ